MRRVIPKVVILAVFAGVLAACIPPPPGSSIRAAFYYGWYPENWHRDEVHNPSAGFYNSADPATLRRQVAEAKYAGLDAFIASWWGIGTRTDQKLPLLLDAAKAQGFRVAPYYEPEGYGNPSKATIAAELAHFKTLADRYGSTWLRVNHKPVIFVYNANDTSCSITQKWHDAAPGWYLNLKVFAGSRNCPTQPDSWHQYVPSKAIDKQLPDSVTISPGFHKYRQTERLSRDPARFARDIATMNASKATWQLVTTYNEWGEGTSVEPSPDWSSSSGHGTYLDLLHHGLTHPTATIRPLS